MIKRCFNCKAKNVPLQRGHMLSKNLAKIIAKKQLPNIEDDEIEGVMHRIRVRRAIVLLCKPCHKHSDDIQKVMEVKLE